MRAPVPQIMIFGAVAALLLSTPAPSQAGTWQHLSAGQPSFTGVDLYQGNLVFTNSESAHPYDGATWLTPIVSDVVECCCGIECWGAKWGFLEDTIVVVHPWWVYEHPGEDGVAMEIHQGTWWSTYASCSHQYPEPNPPCSTLGTLHRFEGRLYPELASSMSGQVPTSWHPDEGFVERWQPLNQSEGPGEGGWERVSGSLRQLLRVQGTLFALGDFRSSWLRPLGGLAWYDGSTWQGEGYEISGDVETMVQFDGHLVVGGNFSQLGPAQFVDGGRVAAHVEGAWVPWLTGVSTVHDLHVFDGQLHAAGRIEALDTTSQPPQTALADVAVWGGSQWVKVGDDLPGPTTVLAEHGGRLYALSDGQIYRFEEETVDARKTSFGRFRARW